MQLLLSHYGNFSLNPTPLQYCMRGHSLITAIASKVSIQHTFLFDPGLTLNFVITELFSLEDEFDGLRSATKFGEAASSQFIQAHSENGTCAVNSEHEDQLIPMESVGENLSAGDDPSAQPIHPSGQQPTSSQTAMAHPTFSFSFPSSSNTRPTGQKGGRCSVCTKALCLRRHECNGSVNRAWCRHGHPPLGTNEKIRWSEGEVERRITECADQQTRLRGDMQ
jgi:hypothetical protein